MAEALAGLSPVTRQTGPSPEAKRIAELERELRRKDKALAEAAAILILRKNAEAIWEGEGDDTHEEERAVIVSMIDAAVAATARRAVASAELGLDARAVARLRASGGIDDGRRRPRQRH